MDIDSEFDLRLGKETSAQGAEAPDSSKERADFPSHEVGPTRRADARPEREPDLAPDALPRKTSDGSLRGPSKRSWRRWFGRFVLMLVALLAIGALSVHTWRYLHSYEWTDDAQVDGDIHRISARIGGTVVAVHVVENQEVKAGDLLVELDPRDFEVAVERAQADLDTAQAQLKSAIEDYRSAVARRDAAAADNFRAQRDVRRYEALLKHGVITEAMYDQYFAAARADRAKLVAAQAAAEAAKRIIATRRAQVKAAQAALKQARLNLSYTKIRAPVAGVVGRKSVETGQHVDPGQTLLPIVQIDNVWITANFKETQVGRMRVGQRATIHVDAFGRDYEGYVEALPGATGERFSLLPPENATGNYVKVVQRLPVRIALKPGEDPHHRLRPGMSVEPTVWLE